MKVDTIITIFKIIFLIGIINGAKYAIADTNITQQTFDQCNLLRVIDGDTFAVTCGESKEVRKVRLYCIDAPEKVQIPYSVPATAKLTELLKANKFIVNIKNKDFYGRYVGEVIDSNKLNINQELVRLGFVAVYIDYCNEEDYYDAQDEAKKNFRGIWMAYNVLLQQTPWVYRQNKKHGLSF